MGFGLRACLGLRAQGLLRAQGSELRVQGWREGLGFRVEGLGFRVEGVSCFGLVWIEGPGRCQRRWTLHTDPKP